MTLPFPENIAERERLMLDEVYAQRMGHEWFPLELRHAGRKIVVGVSRDAMRIGGVRATATADTLWKIATVMGALPLTPRMADQIHQQASVIVAPITRTWWSDGSMAKTARMVEQSQAVDSAVAEGRGLVSGQCKDWVLTRKANRDKAANYGWHVRNGGNGAVTSGLRVLQPLSTAHDWKHVDYSQGIRLMSRACKVDGIHRDLGDVLADPELCGILSHEGPIMVLDPRRDTEPAPPPSAAKPTKPPPPDAQSGDEPGIPYLPARNAGAGGNRNLERKRVDLLVIHTMEAPEKPKTARAVAQWFAGPNAPKASAHWNVDADEIVQSVLERHIAWHAPGANGSGIGIEHAGYARQTEAQWLDAYSLSTLSRSAWLAARICKRWNIPVQRLSITDLRAGHRGFCGHVDVSKAWGKSTHTDPGPNFPWSRYLAMVRAELEALG